MPLELADAIAPPEGLDRDYLYTLNFGPQHPATHTTLRLILTLDEHQAALAAWWQVARDDFARLNDGKKLPEVRQELLTTLKTKLAPLGVLDEFQSAGVFVNWWQKIRYDLKTIVSTGWHHTLIPDEYLIRAFFQDEADAIEALEARISEAQRIA